MNMTEFHRNRQYQYMTILSPWSGSTYLDGSCSTMQCNNPENLLPQYKNRYAATKIS